MAMLVLDRVPDELLPRNCIFAVPIAGFPNMNMRKKLLSYMEQRTDAVLQETCQRHSARVFAKPRIADVLPVENSGISDDLFSFALKGHFDFVVSGSDLTALFVIEFDGPTHKDAVQRLRDSKKNQLCERFELPILRIGADYINRRYRNLHLLTWFVEVWFAKQAFEQMQREGEISFYEPFDPSFFLSIPGLKGRFPLWLSAEPLSKIRRLWSQGGCLDFLPTSIIGEDEDGYSHAFGCLRLSEWGGVCGRIALRNQKFPASSSMLIHELAALGVCDKVQDVLDGTDGIMPLQQIIEAVNTFSSSIRNPRQVGLSMWLPE